MTIYCTLDDDKLSQAKVGILRSSDEGKEVECIICQRPLKIIKDKLYEIIDYFCSEECLSKGYESMEISSSNVVTTKSQRGICENCGGPARGRGWVHNKGCPEIPEVKPKRKCEECGGNAIGKGYRHLDRCSKKISQPQKSM